MLKVLPCCSTCIVSCFNFAINYLYCGAFFQHFEASENLAPNNLWGRWHYCGLSMISVRRNYVKENMQEITNKVINDFTSQPRQLQLLFTHDL